MRRLPPHNKGSDSGSSSGTSTSRSNSPSASSKGSGSPRVTLRLNQLKNRANEDSKKCKVNLSAHSGPYSSESIDSADVVGGGGVTSSSSSSTSKIKMENMEEILLKENSAAIESTPNQDETKDPLADTENVVSPVMSEKGGDKLSGAGGIVGGSDKDGGVDKDSKEAKCVGGSETSGTGGSSNKRHAADNSSDDESKKKKRKEDAAGTKSKTNSLNGGSPKSNPGNESDGDDLVKNVESPGGPKVPPLKIVLPSASTTSESGDLNTSGRNGKTGASRHTGLPYVVPSETTTAETASPVSPALSTGVATSSGGAESNVVPVEGGSGDKSGGSLQGTGAAPSLTTVKQEPQQALTEEQKTTQRILRSSHSRGSSSSSPAAPDASPSTQVNTPPSSAVHSPEAPETTAIKCEPQTQPAIPNEEKLVVVKEEPIDTSLPNPVDLHPRKRKLKHARDSSSSTTSSAAVLNPGGTSSCNSNTANNVTSPAVTSTASPAPGAGPASVTAAGNVTAASATTAGTEPSSPATQTQPPPPTPEQPFTNCYQLYLNMRKQIDLRRKGLFPVKPITPTKFARYLMVTCDYVLANNNSSRHNVPKFDPPTSLPLPLKDLFASQEQDRYKLRMQHVVEKEKFALGVEQEILRVHCLAARELANQPLPYSACTILKDEEVYNLIGPDTDDKDLMEHKKDKRTDRYRYNGRLFIKWLRDIDDKWDKIKKRMITRQTNEAESLHAVQKMDWDWKIRELRLDTPREDTHVPMISIVDDLQSTDEQVTS